MTKNRKPIDLVIVAAALLAGSMILPAMAARIGYWDAAAPGTSIPGYSGSVVWLDQTTNEYDFVGVGSPLPFLDNVEDAWLFSQTTGFRGIGDDDLFDFETDVVAGPGNGKPFSVNALIDWAGPNKGDVPYTIMTKAKRPQVAGAHYTGYAFNLSWDQPDSLQFIQQAGNNTDRSGARRGDGGDGVGNLSGQLVMVTVTHDGSATTGGITFYANGIELTSSKFAQGNLNGTTVNGGQIQIGHNDDTGGIGQLNNGFTGFLYFMEIYDHELSQPEIAARWNGGSPTRATTDPVRSATSNSDLVSLAITTDSAIEFLSEVGETYQLQSTVSTNPPTWTAVGDNVVGTGGTIQMLDPDGFGASKTYRVFRLDL